MAALRVSVYKVYGSMGHICVQILKVRMASSHHKSMGECAAFSYKEI